MNKAGGKEYTPDEAARLTLLRALEWLNWPPFLMQPLIPILYILYPAYWVLGSVFALNIVWTLVRYRFVNLRLSMLGCYFVQFRWITIPACSAYLLWHRHWWLALLTLLTTFVTGLLTSFTRGQAGVIQERFLLQLFAGAVSRQSTAEPMYDLLSQRDKSRKSDASVRDICADWPYEIESLVESLPDLHEFSTSEYSLLPKSFAHERIYNASPMLFAGKQWDVVVGAISGRIYKLAPCISMFSEKEANAA
jgi:hypothetical protein